MFKKCLLVVFMISNGFPYPSFLQRDDSIACPTVLFFVCFIQRGNILCVCVQLAHCMSTFIHLRTKRPKVFFQGK